MNWLLKTFQSKPMALPFDKPEKFKPGLRAIDEKMDQETADKEKLRLKPEYLGSGGMGLVGLTPEGLIVKYTQEKDEVEIARRFMGQNIPCLPVFYDVKEIQSSLWAITMEKIEILPKTREIYEMISLLGYEHYDDMYGMYTSYEHEYTQKYLDSFLAVPYLRKIAEDYRMMMRCLKKHNIIPGDAHSENIGYNKNGNLVLFDLGLSRYNI